MGLRKAVEAILNKFGRDPNSPAEKERRAPSAWSAGGVPADRYTAVPHFLWADVGRLASGKVQAILLPYVWRQTVGLERGRGVKAEPMSPWLPWSHWADICHCSVNAVKEEIADLKKRKVIGAEERHGEVRMSLLWDTWEFLPDYEPGKPEVVPDKPKAAETSFWKRPRAVKPGERSSAKLKSPAETVTLVNSNGSELSYNLVECAREIQVHIVHAAEKANKNQKVSETKGLNGQTTSGLVVDSTVSSPVKPVSKVGFSSPLAASLAVCDVISDISRRRLLEECAAASGGAASEDEITAAVDFYREQGRNKSVRSVSGWVLKMVPQYFGSEAYRAGLKPGESPKQSQEIERLNAILNSPSAAISGDQRRRARERLNQLLS